MRRIWVFCICLVLLTAPLTAYGFGGDVDYSGGDSGGSGYSGGGDSGSNWDSDASTGGSTRTSSLGGYTMSRVFSLVVVGSIVLQRMATGDLPGGPGAGLPKGRSRGWKRRALTVCENWTRPSTRRKSRTRCVTGWRSSRIPGAGWT